MTNCLASLVGLQYNFQVLDFFPTTEPMFCVFDNWMRLTFWHIFKTCQPFLTFFFMKWQRARSKNSFKTSWLKSNYISPMSLKLFFNFDIFDILKKYQLQEKGKQILLTLCLEFSICLFDCDNLTASSCPDGFTNDLCF